jgi:hypothetical protein
MLILFDNHTRTEGTDPGGTATPGQKGQTRGSASARDVDVREEAKEGARCFFPLICVFIYNWIKKDESRGQTMSR